MTGETRDLVHRHMKDWFSSLYLALLISGEHVFPHPSERQQVGISSGHRGRQEKSFSLNSPNPLISI
jgi:hypothetical protein